MKYILIFVILAIMIVYLIQKIAITKSEPFTQPVSVYEPFVCTAKDPSAYYCKQVTNEAQCNSYPACSWGGSSSSGSSSSATPPSGPPPSAATPSGPPPSAATPSGPTPSGPTPSGATPSGATPSGATPSGPAGTNYTGNKSQGNCLTNKFSHAQCPGQFSKCQQKYAFPFYYYDSYLDRVAKQSNVAPQQVQSQAVSHAQGICDKSPAKTYKELGSPPNVTWSQIASIFKGNNPSNSKDCANALIVASGECQPNDGNNTGCIANQSIWQNGPNPPDDSAKAIYSGTTSTATLCKGSPPTVPSGFISAGNSNFIGPFCHTNAWGSGFGWGGGQCAGGV